jgi:hypothetical protein
MTSERLLLKFRIYPERDRFRFYTVFVFDSKRAMYTFFRAQVDILNTDDTRRCDEKCDFSAIATHWTHFSINADGTEVEDERDIGQVLFHRKRVRIGVVSHEMTHAALFWAGREGLDPHEIMESPGEGDHRSAHERVCYVQGELTRQFWLRWMHYLDKEKCT